VTAAPRLAARVLENQALGAAGYVLRLEVGASWPQPAPGQFVMLSAGALSTVTRDDPLLPRPMAIYRAGPATIDVLYKVVGRGTALLALARPDDRVRVVGPLGRGFSAPAAGQRVALVGGGTGIASLLGPARWLSAEHDVTVLLGARTAAELLGREDFEGFGPKLQLATEDGSAGHRGRVTELLEPLLSSGAGTHVYACGPTPMMERAAQLADEAGAACQVSLENRMACGVGICLGCAVPRRGELGFDLVCRDGPVFAAERLDWKGVP
jgi:dihydroorotate dehydrogenase electron transfer subunit